MNTFFAEYSKQLTLAMQECPTDYAWGMDKLPGVLERMRLAFMTFSFNKDSRAIKMTCKALGINHTYKAIRHFFDNHA